MHRVTPGVLVALLLGLAGLARANEVPTPITSAELDAAVSGEVLVDTQRGEVNRGQVIGYIDAPIAEVSDIVMDVGDHDLWFPDTREAEELERDETSNLVRGRTHIPIFRDRTWTLTGAYSEPTYDGVDCQLMEYALVDDDYGNMDECFGYWLLCPSGGGTVVKYVINADLGMWLPQAIVNWAQRRLLPGIITGLDERHGELY